MASRSPPPVINSLHEPSRLAPALLQRWQGFSIGWFDAVDGARSRDVAVQRPLLALIDSGRARAHFSAAGRSRELDVGAGAMGLFVPGQPSHDSLWRSDGARRVIVDVDLQRLHGAVDDGVFDGALRGDLEFHDAELAGLLRAIVDEIAAGCPHGALYAESLSLGLALRLWRDHAAVRSPVEHGRLGAAQMARVAEVVELGIGGRVTLAVMAAAAGYSKAQFVRLFRNTTGCSPHAWVLARRVERARELITGTGLPLVQVAAECGFAGQSHLTGVFSRVLGTTPARLRRETRRAGQAVQATDQV